MRYSIKDKLFKFILARSGNIFMRLKLIPSMGRKWKGSFAVIYLSIVLSYFKH